jgi:hypothetical protein
MLARFCAPFRPIEQRVEFVGLSIREAQNPANLSSAPGMGFRHNWPNGHDVIRLYKEFFI